jgi:hypothetical protein
MKRKSKTTAFDIDLACVQLIELGIRRKSFIRAKIRVSNAAGALVRRALGWQMTLPEAEQAKINKDAVKIMSADDPSTLPSDLALVAQYLEADIATSRKMGEPAEVMQHALELQMRKLARQFPVWQWAKDINGFSDLGVAIVIAEAGRLDKYSDEGKLWKRLGLAPVSKDGVTKACSSWRKTGGLTTEEWMDDGPSGPKYSPRRRASIFSQVGGPIIGGMGKGRRPDVGEDIDLRDDWTYYEKVFVHRLRYEAARDEKMRRPNTKEGKESFSKYAAFRAQRYTEKRLLKHLWQAWQRANAMMSETTNARLPAAVNSNGEAARPVPAKATGSLPPPAPAMHSLLKGQKGNADAANSLAKPLVPKGQDVRASEAPASKSLPKGQATSAGAKNSDAPRGAGEARRLSAKARHGLPPRQSPEAT